jgi:hypothetical protein
MLTPEEGVSCWQLVALTEKLPYLVISCMHYVQASDVTSYSMRLIWVPYKVDCSQLQLAGLTVYEIGCIDTREELTAIRP